MPLVFTSTLDEYRNAFIILSIGPLVFTLTYFITVLKSGSTVEGSNAKEQRKPLVVPYGVPILGNLVQWMRDPHGLLVQLTNKYGYTPFRLRLGPQKLYFVSSPDDIADVFKTGGVVASHEFTLMAIRVLFGMPKAIVKSAYARDNSGIAPKPLPGTNVPPEKRFFHLHHRLVLKEMSGNTLNGMTARFLANLDRQFTNREVGEDWVHIPDLYTWLEKAVFQSSVESLCGTRIFQVCPNLVEEYRDYYNAAPSLLRGLPRFMSPKAYRARDVLLASLKKWHQTAMKNAPLHKFDQEYDGWDEWWGTQLVRQRKALVLAMDGMTDEGMACDDLALILTANVNAIPSVSWLVIDILHRPSLFDRVRPDINTSFLPQNDGTKSLDIVELCKSPLLQSIYAETLRIRTTNMLPRIIATGEQPLKGWIFPKKSAMFVLGNIAAYDKNVWNTGGDEDPHPLEEFWADRFLIYPDDPTSGPLRNPASDATSLDSKEKVGNSPKFSVAGLTGAWIPYGGGMNMCPGRHFAKQELIGTFAMLCHHFDIELTGNKDVRFEPDTGFRIFGSMPPKGKVQARVRRRKV